MDLLKELGPLAIGSRLKRLGNWFLDETNDVYKHYNYELQAKYFPLLYLLYLEGHLGVTDAAKSLNLTHPAVSQMAKGLATDGWIKTVPDPADERRTVLTISDKGKKLIEELLPIWERVKQAVTDTLGEKGSVFFDMLLHIENSLDETKFATRVISKGEKKHKKIALSTWKPKYKDAFHDLNEEWVRRFFHYEDIDAKILQDPEKYILKKGGEVFFALVDGEVAGTGALIKTGASSFELVKMAVSRKFQGQGVGSALLDYILNWARKQGASELTLETNTQLKGALKLYRKFGFQKEEHPAGASDYERADVFMRLSLDKKKAA